MDKKKITHIGLWSAAALIIPLLGNSFVDGWNWSWNDFVFAWVFFVVLGLTYSFVTSKIADRTKRIIAGAGVVLVFAAVWVMLATG
ncbi:MAG: hypothetical protein V4465_00960 [Patescibacteria group bacterium]